uniref:Uncharacterized protein n=1 Tax=Spongospora subterranea TaxID=70186 RepID=A0A0H5RSY8_9EUKA|eukprot:CRZ11839.1 hypothetical protein [Spongospora subterranea]
MQAGQADIGPDSAKLYSSYRSGADQTFKSHVVQMPESFMQQTWSTGRLSSVGSPTANANHLPVSVTQLNCFHLMRRNRRRRRMTSGRLLPLSRLPTTRLAFDQKCSIRPLTSLSNPDRLSCRLPNSINGTAVSRHDFDWIL